MVRFDLYLCLILNPSLIFRLMIIFVLHTQVTWELMAEKRPFAQLKRVWDLPRLVIEGMRPTIDESWPQNLKDLIQDGWLNTAMKRPNAAEFTIRLM